MAVTSQNGWSANDRSVIASYTVPGTTLKIALRMGDVSVILLDYLAWYHQNVESLYNTPQDLWGYAERTIRGSSTTLSNHASGTAVDARAVKHPLGVRGTLTAEQSRKIDDRLKLYNGTVVRHGKDYSGRVDEMHAEINAGAAAVKAVADRIRAGQLGAPPTSEGFLMALTDKEQLEILNGIRAMKPGIRFTARSSNSRRTSSDGLEDQYGFVMNAEANAADAAAGVAALRAQVDRLAASPGPPVSAGSLSDSDVQRIAQAVVQLLGKKASA